MGPADLQLVRKKAEQHVRWLKAKLPAVYNGMVENLVIEPDRSGKTLGFALADGFDVSSLVDSVPNAIDVVTPSVDYASIPTTDTSGGSSIFSGLVDSVTNLLSSGGVSTLVNAAQPFINNAVQQQALGTQLTQLRNGLPVTIAGTTTPMPVQPLKVTAAGAVAQLSSYMPLILLGGGALILMRILSGKRK